MFIVFESKSSNYLKYCNSKSILRIRPAFTKYFRQPYCKIKDFVCALKCNETDLNHLTVQCCIRDSCFLVFVALRLS